MRKSDTWLGSMLWIAVAILMPAAALEPVTPAQAAPAPVETLSSACPDGSANLAMGCESIHL